MSSTAENKPLTVIIPVYNRGDVVLRTLNSVAQQDACLFRLIIVDNDSTDDSVSVVNRWMDEHPEVEARFLTEPFHSAGAARNRGLTQVTTPWVMFFDSDDAMLPGHISSAVEVARSHPEADIIGWDVVITLPDGSTRLMKFPENEVIKNHIVHGSLSTQRYMVRSSLIREAGGWNPGVRRWNDLELGLRLLCSSRNVVRRDGKSLVKVYFTPKSISGNNFSANGGECERALDEMEGVLKAKKPEMTDWIAYRRADLAAAYSKEGSKEMATVLLKKAKARAQRPWLVTVIYQMKLFIPRGVWKVADLIIRGK